MKQQLRILGVAARALEPGEIGVDLFAGGGGWSEGFQRAVGVPPAIAVNHDEDAIEMHTANHPETEHHHEDVFEVDPLEATRGRRVGWLHLSPDCTHFSRAKGGKPRSQKIRGLAWVAITWAKAVSPRIVSLENVAEFQTWGPLGEDGQPIRERAGETFAEFVWQLRELGYAVEWKILNSADYGAPTSRRRLFLIARRDGRAIAWPKPTHGPKRPHRYRTAAECIDWSIPVPSIFDRKKPLAEATQRRIAEGIRRYVLNNPRPFLVTLTHGARLEPLDEPFKTLTAAHRGEKALVAPTLIQMGYGERKGQKPRVLDLHQPLGTIVGGGKKHALVTAFIAKHYGGVVGHRLDDRPLGTVTAWDHHSLVAVHMESMYSNSKGNSVDEPAPTLTAQSNHHALVATTLMSNNSNNAPHGVDEPLGTITSGNRHYAVAAFLAKYYGCDKHGQAIDEPLHTVPTVDRFGLVTVSIEGEEFVLADIGMRMLQPRELARAQGFPDSYVLTGTKTAQVARIGNSVCPDVAAAIVAANLGDSGEAEVAA